MKEEIDPLVAKSLIDDDGIERASKLWKVLKLKANMNQN